jgi:hypothetical protein
MTNPDRRDRLEATLSKLTADPIHTLIDNKFFFVTKELVRGGRHDG